MGYLDTLDSLNSIGYLDTQDNMGQVDYWAILDYLSLLDYFRYSGLYAPMGPMDYLGFPGLFEF